MSIIETVEKMYEYYRDRVPYHDKYMNYTDNLEMENLLAPIIKKIEARILNKDVLEVACKTGAS